MDADDIAYPQRLEKQLAYAEQHPDVDLFGTWMIVFGQAGHVRGKRMGTITPDFRYSTWTSIPIAHPTFFGHTKWFQENRYTTVYRYSQDQHLLLRTFRHSHFAVLPEILLGYREEKLTCVKQVRSRLSYFRCASQLVGELGYAGTAATLGAQAGKLGLDLLTILTHQDHRVLRSRAHAVTQQEQEEWVQVWQTLINSPQNLPAN
jgi:hypothetical protein